jgi:hypothetical protein
MYEPWLKDPQSFIAYIGKRPSKKHSLDRIDNEKGYEPGNLRWATSQEQRRNARTVRPMTINGTTRLITEWAKMAGITNATLQQRIDRGWEIELALTAPKGTRRVVRRARCSRSPFYDEPCGPYCPVNITAARFDDISGKKFHRVTVIGLLGKFKGRVYWSCRCQCGRTKAIQGDLLRCGMTRSCGCLMREAAAKRRIKHNMTHCPEYNAWARMRGRCNNANDPSFRHYGGRGIKVCRRWRRSFVAFYIDMGQRPSPKHSLDRIDVNRGYSPDNCRWSTPCQQVHNRRCSVGPL